MIFDLKFQFFIYILLLLGTGQTCTEFVRKFPEYTCEQEGPVFRTQYYSYYMISKERNQHFLVESDKPINTKFLDQNRHLFASVPINAESSMNNSLILVNRDQLEQLRFLYNKGKIKDIVNVIIKVVDEVKRNNAAGLLIWEIGMDNVLISKDQESIAFLDLGSEKVENSHLNKLYEHQIDKILSLYFKLAERSYIDIDHNVNFQKKLEYKRKLDFMNSKLRQVDPKKTQLDELITILKQFPDKQEGVSLHESTDQHEIHTPNGFAMYSVVGIANINKPHIYFVLSISIVLILFLVFTIALMSRKEANLSDEDQEMLVLRHNTIDTFYI